MGDDAERRVRAEALVRQAGDDQRDGERDGEHPSLHRKGKGERQRDAENRRVGGRVAEIGHAPPDDETAERPGGERHAKPRQQGADIEIIKHHLAA